MLTATVQVPEKLEPVIFSDAPYIVVHGGRGSGKSHTVAKRLLIKAVQRRRKIMCVREVQKSLEESVLQLLSDQIDLLGLGDFYRVMANEIRGKNGSRFIFAGIKTDPKKIKSTEGVTDIWFEEAENVTKRSYDLALPILRNADPQVFVTFNAFSEQDETYQRFVVSPPAGALVIKANFDDNPWFPGALQAQMLEAKKNSWADYLHIWQGMTIEESGTTEIPVDKIREWEADRLDNINWYLLVDPSGSKKKVDGDYTVMSPAGIGADRNLYFGHWLRDKMTLLEKWNAMFNLHERYRFKAIGYEDSNGGVDLDYFAQRGRELNYRLQIVALKNTVFKNDRIRLLIPDIQEGRLYVPRQSWYTQQDGKNIDLTVAFKKEATLFPHIAASVHDDMLDAMSRIKDPDLGVKPPSARPWKPGSGIQRQEWDPVTIGM